MTANVWMMRLFILSRRHTNAHTHTQQQLHSVNNVEWSANTQVSHTYLQLSKKLTNKNLILWCGDLLIFYVNQEFTPALIKLRFPFKIKHNLFGRGTYEEISLSHNLTQGGSSLFQHMAMYLLSVMRANLMNALFVNVK